MVSLLLHTAGPLEIYIFISFDVKGVSGKLTTGLKPLLTIYPSFPISQLGVC